MDFLTKRAKIKQALNNAGVAEILTSKDKIPNEYPAALVVLSTEKGTKAVHNKYTSTEVNFDIFLIIPSDARIVDDPDAEIHELKETFRTQFQELVKSDFSHVKYYNSKAGGTKDVKVAYIREKAE